MRGQETSGFGEEERELFFAAEQVRYASDLDLRGGRD